MAHTTEVGSTQMELELCWTQKMADFERRLNASLTPTNPSLLQLQEEFRLFKELVVNMLNLLRQQIRNNASEIDSMDMRSRQNILLFSGISEECNAEHEVLSLLHNKLGLTDISGSSLKRCHRLGVKSNDYVRSVLVQFHNHHIKSAVWSLKAKFKGSTVSVYEFLTKPRQLVHKRARKHFGLKNVWTLDGSINIKVPGGTRVRVVTGEELDLLIAKYPTDAQPIGSSGKIDDGSSPVDGCHKDQLSVPSSNRQLEVRRKPGGTPTADIKRSRRPVPKK